MKSLERSSEAIPRWIIVAFSIISLIGFADAAYLTANHYLGTSLNCSLFEGCEVVTTSVYATVAGVPIALVGALYYLLIFVATIAYFDTGNLRIMRFAAYFTVLGFLASLWLLYLQLFVIEALCMYCLLSLVTSTILFLLGLLVIKSCFSEVRPP